MFAVHWDSPAAVLRFSEKTKRHKGDDDWTEMLRFHSNNILALVTTNKAKQMGPRNTETRPAASRLQLFLDHRGQRNNVLVEIRLTERHGSDLVWKRLHPEHFFILHAVTVYTHDASQWSHPLMQLRPHL